MFKRIIPLAATAVACLALGATAATAEDFYKNKRIQMVVGSGAGGGYDTYSRTLARHMERIIPGNPSIIVQNKRGAGSIIAMNYVQNVLPKDGTAIAGLQREIALVQIMGNKQAEFDVAKLNWLGSLNSEAGVCAVATRTGAKAGSFDMAFDKPFIMGGLGRNDTEMQPALMNNLLGTKFKLIRGYGGTPQLHLAIQRGEADGICQSWSSFKKAAGNFYTDGKIQPIIQMSLKSHPELEKMGVPTLDKFVSADKVQDGMSVADVKSFLQLAFAAKVMGRPFALAEGVPAERVKALRDAFDTATTDEKFLADAKKQRRPISAVSGAEIQEMVEAMAAVPKEKLGKLESLLEYKGDVSKAK